MTPFPPPADVRRYLRLVRASAWYDLVVTAGFMTPWTYVLLHRALSWAGEALGLGGMPPLDPVQTLYANLMGSVVVVWSLLRLTGTRAVHGVLDAAARVLFALWQGYALAHGATRLLWFFLVVEVAFGAVQLAPWVRRRARRATGSARAETAAAGEPASVRR
ncbi:hypothetical protein NPS70_00320 [Streptomyces sp. C10-9-1]|uniref:hypothetical protein n=1 Tax=Streptomyces sp. C10-9-1 TaxID=1859285 RepID=UPI002113869B|nr:hypothetical protein [Streptomyces sp. C10-9-1]MCQ6551651.1 hypothetical protein [Streptomyces sp. C10-9-1]